MSEDKIRDIIDKVKRGEIGLGSAEVTTSRTDEGEISSTLRRRCGPCNVGNHSECEGDHVCDCNHPSHNRQIDNESSVGTTAEQQRSEQEAKPQPDDQQGTQPPAPT